jgi:uncharacterized RDD family membrane protein YckC
MAETTIFAGRMRRLAATVIDAILVPFVTLILVAATGVVEHAEDYQDNAWMLHVLLLAIGSYLLLNGFGLWRSGQTIGKRLLGIRIASAATAQASGERDQPTAAPFWRLILIRAWFFPLLFVVMIPWVAWLPLLDQGLIFTRKRRCLHDLLAGTVVLRVNREASSILSAEAK